MLAATAIATVLSVSSALAPTIGLSQIGSESGRRAAETNVTAPLVNFSVASRQVVAIARHRYFAQGAGV